MLLLSAARQLARTDEHGDLVLLADQDRNAWDAALIAEGQGIVRSCIAHNRPGRYQIQAAINAVHCDATSAALTDWTQILTLYDQLLVFDPSPVVTLHRAVAVAEVHGPAVALPLVEESALEEYYLFHAIRADLLRRLERPSDAATAYRAAITHTDNASEIAFLQHQLAKVERP